MGVESSKAGFDPWPCRHPRSPKSTLQTRPAGGQQIHADTDSADTAEKHYPGLVGRGGGQQVPTPRHQRKILTRIGGRTTPIPEMLLPLPLSPSVWKHFLRHRVSTWDHRPPTLPGKSGKHCLARRRLGVSIGRKHLRRRALVWSTTCHGFKASLEIIFRRCRRRRGVGIGPLQKYFATVLETPCSEKCFLRGSSIWGVVVVLPPIRVRIFRWRRGVGAAYHPPPLPTELGKYFSAVSAASVSDCPAAAQLFIHIFSSKKKWKNAQLSIELVGCLWCVLMMTVFVILQAETRGFTLDLVMAPPVRSAKENLPRADRQKHLIYFAYLI